MACPPAPPIASSRAKTVVEVPINEALPTAHQNLAKRNQPKRGNPRRWCQKARDTLGRLALDARQLTRWQTDAMTDAERIEVARLLAIIPEIHPLIQRQIALATKLDTRARTGSVSPHKK